MWTRSRAFTLLELSVVVIILSLLAALVVPNLVRQEERRERREFFSALARFAENARESAISEGRTLSIQLGSSGRSFVLVEESEDGERERATLQIPEGIETGSFSAQDAETSSAEWMLRFYADGSSDGGGIELSDAGRPHSLEVRTDGTIRTTQGPLELESTEEWPAGDYERRA